ncbi:MAG: hypothetical protein A4E19_02840 [Nitrospira sp. SG-bin1]|nr:MAG: hypothetical protein A4E19_02840 [Nitrospira sp. SG-bin1]
MVEKNLEDALAAKLERALLDRSLLRDIRIISGTSDASCLYDLVSERDYKIFQDRSDWNPVPTLMIDVAGGMVPDLVLRSIASNENRIYIEVKYTEDLNYDRPLSQIVRYFLHLLCTTRQSPLPKKQDIRRAVLLAAPSAWFENKTHANKWYYFLDRYADLAKLPEVDITLGELRLDTTCLDTPV